MLEMLPTPWGLVRSGVAPDHPKIKSISKTFEKTAGDPRFRFFGNVMSASTSAPTELAERYDAVIYAVGAQSDRALGIPGEELPGSVAAVDFVGWYNAHPHFEDMTPDLSSGRAVVIGNGNVALDVARILVTDPTCWPTPTSPITPWSRCDDRGVDEVVIVGRRGPLQSAFTTLELRELATSTAWTWWSTRPTSTTSPTRTPTAAGKIVQAEHQGVARLRGPRAPAGTPPHRVPVPDLPDRDPGRGTGRAIVLGRNELVTDEQRTGGGQGHRRARELPVQLVVRAVGYRGVPTPGLPFDDGAGDHPATRRPDQRQPQRVRRRLDQARTVRGDRHQQVGLAGHRRHADRRSRRPRELREFGPDHADELVRWLPGRQPNWSPTTHWETIDRYERAAGEPHGRPRVKICRTWPSCCGSGTAELFGLVRRVCDLIAAPRRVAYETSHWGRRRRPAARRTSCRDSSASTPPA